ncbi:MAG: MFS transporter [Rhodomicrobium sp.]
MKPRLTIKGYFTGLSRSTFLLAFASFFSDISTEMLYPVLPVFLIHTLHADGTVVGLVDGFAQAVQNLVQGFSGSLSDKLQKRKPIALAGYFLSAISKPFMGVSAAWQGLFAARVVDRLGAGTRAAPRDALLAASADEQHRGKAFGLEGFGDNAGAFVGPLIALLLLNSFHAGMRSIFYLALIPGLLAFSMVLMVRERPVAAGAKVKIGVNFRQFPKVYWRYLLATAIFGIGNSSNAFLILRTQDAGGSLDITILIYAAFNLVAALISYPAGFVSDTRGRKGVLLAAFAIFTAAYLGFASTRNIAAIAGLFAAYGLYQGIFRAVGKALAADLVPASLRASGVGWYSTTLGLLQLIASLIAGLLWDRIGHSSVFLYGAAFGALGFLALLILIPDGRKQAGPSGIGN